MFYKIKRKKAIKMCVSVILPVILAFGCHWQGTDDAAAPVAEAFTADGGTRAPGPDLSVSYIYHTYAQLVINQFETFKVYVYNTGSAASAATNLTFQLGGSLKIMNIPALAPGSYCTISRGIGFASPGAYLITATADPYNTVSESNESNNTKQITMYVYDYGKPDLYISYLTPSSSPAAGKFTYFTIQVKNNLQCGMSPITKVQVRIGGESTGMSYTVPALAPGQGYNLGRGWTPSRAGNYRITAIADSENDADEKNESNNIKYSDVTVGN